MNAKTHNQPDRNAKCLPQAQNCQITSWCIIILFVCFFAQVEDIFNESDESSSEESKQAGDDLDDEENPPENRLLSLEAEDSSQDRLKETQETVGSSDSEGSLYFTT